MFFEDEKWHFQEKLRFLSGSLYVANMPLFKAPDYL
jgi:hypothetical protein